MMPFIGAQRMGAKEPVPALDVSARAQALVLPQNLQREFSLTILLISHSLPMVPQLASLIAVMQGARIVEAGPAEQVLRAPAIPHSVAHRRHPRLVFDFVGQRIAR
jgi:peptide/nickel transport system ATP-binding protein